MTYRLLLLLVVATSAACSQPAAQANTPPPATYSTESHQVTIGGARVPLTGAAVKPEFFQDGAARPLLGRLFLDADYQLGSGAAVILSHELWATRFASDPAIIGQPVPLDGHPAIVVGVMPDTFRFPSGAQYWLPQRAGAAR